MTELTCDGDVIITRKVHFCSSHRLHAPSLSDDANQSIFGKCNNPNGHGHNYVLIVALKGPVDPVTGMVFNLAELADILDDTIMYHFDHKHLDKDTPFFAERPSTAENIAMVCCQLLLDTPVSGLLYYVELEETLKNVVRVYA